jgi:hypothetical protein
VFDKGCTLSLAAANPSINYSHSIPKADNRTGSCLTLESTHAASNTHLQMGKLCQNLWRDETPLHHRMYEVI